MYIIKVLMTYSLSFHLRGIYETYIHIECYIVSSKWWIV